MKPIDYPTIVVEAHSSVPLVVRKSIACDLLMKRRGLPILDLKAATDPTNPDSIENWLKIFACMVDENFEPGTDPTKYVAGNGPSADYWATKIQPDQINEMCRVCNESIAKTEEALMRRRLAAVPPPKEIAS